MPPDALPVSREAIDSFIRDRGVTKVPRGKSGLVDENGNWIGGNIFFRKRGRPRKAPPPAPKPDPAPEPHLPARRANVERFAAVLEAKPEPPKAPETPSAAHTAAVRSPGPGAASKADPAAGRSRLKHDDEIRRMAENDWTVRMIADALGLSRSGVRKACDRLGVEPHQERVRDPDRKHQVAELIEAGKTAVEIGEALSLTRARVYQIATRLGKKVPSRWDAVKEQIRTLVAEGKHVGEIAEALDRSEQSIYVTLGRLGLKAASKRTETGPSVETPVPVAQAAPIQPLPVTPTKERTTTKPARASRDCVCGRAISRQQELCASCRDRKATLAPKAEFAGLADCVRCRRPISNHKLLCNECDWRVKKAERRREAANV